MPPVLGPSSSSRTRLKSWAGLRGTTVVPSHRQNSDTSGPERNSSTTTAPSGLARQARACSRASLPVVRHDDSLAGGQPVVLDDVGCAERVERRLHLVEGRAHVGEPGRHLGRGHDVLGEGLAPLQPGRLRGRTEARDAGRAHGIRDARHEGGLRTDDDEVRGDLSGEGDDPRRVGHAAGERHARRERPRCRGSPARPRPPRPTGRGRWSGRWRARGPLTRRRVPSRAQSRAVGSAEG